MEFEIMRNLGANSNDSCRFNQTKDRFRLYGWPAILCILTVLICLSPAQSEGQAQSGKAIAKMGSGQTTTSKLKKIKQRLLDADRFVHQYTNEERLSRGLPQLEPSSALSQLAKEHSLNMCRSGAFQHESNSFPQGWRTFPRRLKNVGLSSGGENIGYQTVVKDTEKWAKGMVDGWMKSPTHRKNILDPRFRYMGVGIRPCKNDLGYATQVFSDEPGEKR